MRNIKIFTEHGRHIKFLSDFISVRFPLVSQSNIIGFINLSGIQNIDRAKPSFIANSDEADGVNLVIIDTNFGVNKDHDMLEKIKIRLEIDFDYFILPNNNDDGVLETLLIGLIPSKFSTFTSCFDTYVNHLGRQYSQVGQPPKNKKIYSTPSDKGKIYAYLDAVLSARDEEMINAEKRDYKNVNYWDTRNSAADALAGFISSHLIQPPRVTKKAGL